MNKKSESILKFVVDAGSSGQRVDKFLSARIDDLSRSCIQGIIRRGKAKVNDKSVNKHYNVSEKDLITLEYPGERDSVTSIEPQKIDLKILYEDRYLLVLSKEAGMLTHPVRGFNKGTLVNALLYHYDKLSDVSGIERLGIVHRLDRDTSGLLIIAKDNKTHRLLSDKFKKREIKKTYAALVWGRFFEEKGEVVLPIGRSRLDRKKMNISIDGGRDSVTRFEIKEEFKYSTLLDVSPKTGRTHQIRVHLSYIEHPVIGDSLYGNRNSKKLAKELGIKRQFLHAKRLEFEHPVTGKRVVAEDKLSDDLLECLKDLRRRYKMER
ncbi:MAG: RluA family pseudouridine synthase [Actinomycetota bacterium]|nr:RluA family pseudouridine synthase [Actinomycetota bacterium]